MIKKNKKQRCCIFNFLCISKPENDQNDKLILSENSDTFNSPDSFFDLSPSLSSQSSVFSAYSDIEYNELYEDMCKIIGNTNYFKNGLIIGDNNDYDKNWYISSTIKFKCELDDQIILWKHIKNDIWHERILTVKEILQFNGF